MTTNETVVPVRQRLRDALTVAIKGRDRVAASVVRATLGAIENAEAVERPGAELVEGGPRESSAIEATPAGVGVAEVARRVLTEADVRAIVRAEVAEREAAVAACERAGRDEQAERLRVELNVLVAFAD
ncbi:hypothetical protein [Streptacidiphilus sp. MAP5-3]|uniref:hypothetical protein n=1 Tax=unclassified Streptacidiphilus TaxID=2643834 RepID=UPI0035114B29